ncbi:MAG TPA: zf-TFIIB domain-containing protein [Pyrinomonadaceae bacterium]|jgi:ribosomal protein L31|nr:zf-TFIIB domain-containing protein [Pyrinomonadaceae bacterium]
MSQVTLEDRAHALENEYFLRQEKKLIQRLKEKLEAEQAEASKLECPKCHGKLVDSTFENIVIEICNNCHGVWLDADDLVQIAHHDEHQDSWFGRWFGK